MNPKFFWLITAILLVSFQRAEAQQPKKVPRIGFLYAGSPSGQLARAEAFRQGLRELGYVEGKNIVIEYRHAEGKYDRLPRLAAELVRLKVDLIVVAGGEDLIRATKNATKTIPIVMAGAGRDPVRAGLVEKPSRRSKRSTRFPSLLFVELRATSSHSYGVPLEYLYGSRPRVKGGYVARDGHHRSNSPAAKEIP